MWNKDLKDLENGSGETIWESFAAFVMAVAATLLLWVVLAMLAV